MTLKPLKIAKVDCDSCGSCGYHEDDKGNGGACPDCDHLWTRVVAARLEALNDVARAAHHAVKFGVVTSALEEALNSLRALESSDG